MELLIASLLRPYRSTYSSLDLGRRKTSHYERTDETLPNDRDQNIHFSYYANTKPTDVCIIYCHCNSGSRMEGTPRLTQVSSTWNNSPRRAGMSVCSTSQVQACPRVATFRWGTTRRGICSAFCARCGAEETGSSCCGDGLWERRPVCYVLL